MSQLKCRNDDLFEPYSNAEIDINKVEAAAMTEFNKFAKKHQPNIRSRISNIYLITDGKGLWADVKVYYSIDADEEGTEYESSGFNYVIKVAELV